MAEVTNELMYEFLKRIHSDLSPMKEGLGEVRQELVSIRLTQLGMQNDIHNIYGILARHEERFDRIGQRLEFRELVQPQRPFDLNS